MLVARKLGKKVIENCALKLRPYMMQAVESMGFPLDNYDEIVANICQETSDVMKQNEANGSNECVVCILLKCHYKFIINVIISF